MSRSTPTRVSTSFNDSSSSARQARKSAPPSAGTGGGARPSLLSMYWATTTKGSSSSFFLGALRKASDGVSSVSSSGALASASRHLPNEAPALVFDNASSHSYI